MPIQVKCANQECAKALRIKDELAGKTIRCPECKNPVKVPGAVAPTMAPAAPKQAPKAPPPPPPATPKKPAPMPPKTAPKPRPVAEDVPTLEAFDDFDDPAPAKNKVTSKPAPAIKCLRCMRFLPDCGGCLPLGPYYKPRGTRRNAAVTNSSSADPCMGG